MSVPVNMPQLGESVTEGTVTRWLKQVGDAVSADEPLLEVSTDKVDTEIPSPASGVVLQIIADEDDVVEVGGALALIGEPGEAPAQGGPAPAATPEPTAAPPTPQASAPEPTPAAAAPAAQSMPESHGGDAGGTAVLLPALGESVTEGTVTRWLKEIGESVDADEPLLEVSTDKVDTEIPSPVAGVLLAISVGEDETAEVGAELGFIGAPGAAPAAEKPAPAPEPAAAPAAAAPAVPSPAPAKPAAPIPAPAKPAAPSRPVCGTLVDRSREPRLRHPAGAQARRPTRCRSRLGQGHRRGRSYPAPGRVGSRRGRHGCSCSGNRPRPRRPPPGHRPPPPRRARCAARPRRCRVCAR